MWGGRDHGLYVINGVNISYTGSLRFESDELKVELFQSPYFDVTLGYPGLFSAYSRGLSDDQGLMIAQFLPMYMAATSIAYDLFGLPGVFRLNGIIALFSSLVIYYLCKHLFAKGVATLALALIMLNPAQLWNGRIPGTEILSQLLFFLAVYFFSKAWLLEKLQKNFIILSALSGLLIVFGMFTRIDTYIWGIGIFVLWSYVALFKRDKLISARVLGLIYAAGVCLSLWFCFSFSHPYFDIHWQSGHLSGIIYINIFFFALVLIAEIMAVIVRRLNTSIPDFLTKLLDSSLGCRITCAVFMLVFIAAYFVRPSINDTFDGNAMVEFTWYTSFIAIPLTIYGFFLAFRGNRKKLEAQYLLLLVGIVSVVGYIYRPSIYPDHFWVSRRWVTVNIPFVLIYCSYAIASFFEHVGKVADKKRNSYIYSMKEIVGSLSAVIIVVYSVSQSSIFLFQPMFEDAVVKMANFAEQLDSNAIFLTTNYSLASPMRFVFHRQVYLTDSVPEHDSNFARRIYFICDGTAVPTSFQTTYQLVGAQRISGKTPEGSIGSYPEQLIDWGWDFSLFRLTPGRGYIAYDLSENISGFSSQNSEILEGNENSGIHSFISDGSEGYLLFGPYVSLDSGNYTVDFYIRLLEYDQDELGWIEVHAQYDERSQTFAKKQLTPDLFSNEQESVITLPFSLPMPQDDIEYRIFVTEGTILQAGSLIIKEIDVFEDEVLSEIIEF